MPAFVGSILNAGFASLVSKPSLLTNLPTETDKIHELDYASKRGKVMGKIT